MNSSTTSRRKFIENTLLLSLLPSVSWLWNSCKTIQQDLQTARIERIELFRYDINTPRYFSWGTWHNRQHLFMKMSSGKQYGWSEIPASKNNPDFYPTEWINYLESFKQLTLAEAQQLLLSQQVVNTKIARKKLEFIEMALLDLTGKVLQQPAITLLNLSGQEAIPGLFCILDKDIDKVKAEAQKSIAQQLGHHLKFKMYGDKTLDMKLLSTVRQVLGDDSVVISDANRGYKDWKSLGELASILSDFEQQGLSAIEDPASLTVQQWIGLQNKLDRLSLIPDHPMRPAWEGIEKIKAGMGNIYNLHPSTMGSFTHTAQLANTIQSFGAKVMIGDDSLVGPACSAWQQVAIGAGAVWVEAIEKSGDSDDYLSCVVKKATRKTDDGYFAYQPSPGFGIELDEKRLKRICELYVEV